MTRKPTTLREVAERADVSVATVSYVLSGKGRMTPETRRTIAAMLREAGIRPRYKRYPVFYISDHDEFGDMYAFDPLFRLYCGLNAAFHEEEVNLRMEFLRRSNPDALKAQLDQLLALRPGAVVLDSSLREDMEQIGQFFERQHIPAIQVGHTVRAPGLDAVVVDSFSGAYAAVTYFLKNGHNRIATIRWNSAGDPASSKKFAGYTCALGEANIAIRPEYVVESPFTRKGDRLPGRVAAEQLLALPEPPTAVFVENSFISPSLIYTAYAGEQEVPKPIRDLDIIHFEAWYVGWMEQALAGNLCHPARRTKLLRINWEEMGRTTAKRVLTRMEGAEKPGQILQLVPSLFEASGDTYTAL